MTITAGVSYPGAPQADRTELARLLLDGPFPEALRAAIRASRLSLDRIQHRLRARGMSVSVATLSYWQSGRRRPERPESMLALRELETVLDVPTGALSGLLGPPRPRGRRGRAQRPLAMDALWNQREPLRELLAEVDTGWDDQLARISQHDRCEIAADGGHRALRVRQVLRAEVDGPDRWVLVFDLDEPGGPLPAVRTLRNCTQGKTVVDRAAGLMVAELVFPRALSRGDTVIMEYELVYPGPPFPAGGNYYCRRFRLPIRDYVVEVRFDPAVLPVHCHQFSTPADASGPIRRRNLTPDSSGCVHAVSLGYGPGVFGIRWDPLR